MGHARLGERQLNLRRVVTGDGILQGSRAGHTLHRTGEVSAMENDTELVVASFHEEGRASEVLDELQELKRMKSIGIMDAAVIEKDKNGRLKVSETAEGEGVLRGAGIGAIAGGILGLLVGGPIGGIVLGSAAGALAGKVIDLGFSNRELKELGDLMGPNSSAIVAVIERSFVGDLCEVLGDHGAAVMCKRLDNEDAEGIAMEEDPDASASAPSAASGGGSADEG